MQNTSLVTDYLRRCNHRLAAIDVLYERESWPDVVRECQEVVELALKALLRHARVEVPRIHDVSAVLHQERGRIAVGALPHLDRLAEVSRSLRRDRELAFYGSEDLTPSDFYKPADALQAREDAQWLVGVVLAAVAD